VALDAEDFVSVPLLRGDGVLDVVDCDEDIVQREQNKTVN
jgi:hypothetical protein